MATTKLSPAQERTLVAMLQESAENPKHGVSTRTVGASITTMTVLSRMGFVRLTERFASGTCLFRLTNRGRARARRLSQES